MGPGMLLVYEAEIAHRREQMLRDAASARLAGRARAAAGVRPAGALRRLATWGTRLAPHSHA